MGKQIVLEGEGIATGYRQGKQLTEVHHGLDFSLSGGELTCLLGCNGAGKSTLLRTLAGMQPPLSGRLELMGRPLEAYSAHERSKTIGVVLTDRMQAGGLTVYELVALGRQPYTGFFGRLTSADKALVWRALEEVGMAGKARRYVAELSDGERQKAMIAKVLVQECPLILLDEPTAFLDVESRMEVMRLLRKLAVEEHKAVLLSTHDVDQALAMSDRLWLMTQEREMLCGPRTWCCRGRWTGCLAARPSVSMRFAASMPRRTVTAEWFVWKLPMRHCVIGHRTFWCGTVSAPLRRTRAEKGQRALQSSVRMTWYGHKTELPPAFVRLPDWSKCWRA